MVATRERIRRHVHDTPGVHFNRLGRELELATGQVQYHLRRLREAGEVVAEPVGGQTHYFPPGYDPWERRLIGYLRRETPRAILVRLHANGPTRPVDLADELGLARSTVAYHVSNLADAGVVDRSTDEPMRVALAEPVRTADLLDAVSPSLPDRVVDRFVRTVDRLFE
ncbi:MAG: winged helix-turn-helix transcriptional regulator [Halorubrum sp.]